MSKKFDVVAITGKYTDNSGQEKNRYTNIGVVLETKHGLSLKLEAVPVGWDGWAGLYEPKERENSAEQRQSAPRQQQRAPAPHQGGGGFEGMDDDIPFSDPMKCRAFALSI